MKILFLGYSDFIQRRVIPIIVRDFKKMIVGIATKSKKNDPKYKNFYWFDDYIVAIKRFKPDIVYISLPNALHFKYGKIVLKNKINLIIDKPMCLKRNNAKILIDLALKNDLLLSESIIFNHHPQIRKAISLCGGLNKIETLESNFCIPKPNKGNIKLSYKLGGGVNNDMGPYAAGVVRIFLKKFPDNINVFFNKKNRIITDLSVQSKTQNKIVYSYFSFGKEYKNNLIIFTKNKIITVNNVFSPNPFQDTNIIVKHQNKFKYNKIKKSSTFKNFFLIYLKCLKNKNFKYFTADILYDSKFRDLIDKKLYEKKY